MHRISALMSRLVSMLLTADPQRRPTARAMLRSLRERKAFTDNDSTDSDDFAGGNEENQRRTTGVTFSRNRNQAASSESESGYSYSYKSNTSYNYA